MKVEHVLLFLVGVFLVYHLIKIYNCKNIECFQTNDDLGGNYKRIVGGHDDIGKNIYFLYISNYFIRYGDVDALQKLLNNEYSFEHVVFDFSDQLKNEAFVCSMKETSDALDNEQIKIIIDDYILNNNFNCS